MTRDNETEPDEGTSGPSEGEATEMEHASELGGDVVARIEAQSRAVTASNSELKIVISPRLVAVWSFIFGVGCLAALAFVASVRDAATLSTIALALAIVAFGVQLLASAAQNQATTQQSVRSEQLNTQTHALLAEMQTTARATERMVREQFSQLLRAFLDAAKATEGGKHFDPAEFEEKLMSNIRREARISRGASPTVAERSREIDIARRERERARALKAEEEEAKQRVSGPFPAEEEALPVASDLRAMDSDTRSRLREYAVDKAWAEISDSKTRFEGFPVSGEQSEPTVDSQLADRGLLQLVRVGDKVGTPEGLVYQMTDRGELASRILNATGPVPGWAEELLQSGEAQADK